MVISDIGVSSMAGCAIKTVFCTLEHDDASANTVVALGNTAPKKN